MPTDFIAELADTVHQTCKLLEAPEHRNDIAQGARCLANAIEYLERESAKFESNDSDELGLAAWLTIRGPTDDSPFMDPLPKPFLGW